jgi:hypothetical protein
MTVIKQGGGWDGLVYDLSHPRVGWRRETGTVTASTSAAGYAADNAASSRTDTFWRPTAMPATWEVDFGASKTISYCGIAAHDLGTNGNGITVERWTGSTWASVASTTATNDEPLMFLFAAQTASQMRLSITGTAPTIGVIFFGAVTEWPRKALFAPSVSMQRATVTEYNTNITESGQFVGRTAIRRNTTPRMQVQYLAESWIASEFDAFVAYARSEPFFICDRPGNYPESVAYAFAMADLIPERQAPNQDATNAVTLELMGFRAR